MPQAASVYGIPKTQRCLLIRALALEGVSQSCFIKACIRRTIEEKKKKYGQDLFNVLTDTEAEILEIIASGAAEIQQIAEESFLSVSRGQRIVDTLIDCGYVMKSRRAAKTDMARGAVVAEYRVTDKYYAQSK